MDYFNGIPWALNCSSKRERESESQDPLPDSRGPKKQRSNPNNGVFADDESTRDVQGSCPLIRKRKVDLQKEGSFCICR
jgi:hypothetical protein